MVDENEQRATVFAFPKTPRVVAEDEIQPRPKAREVIGDVLREERLDQQRTLSDVAERAAVSLPYLSEVERGRKEVSSDLLESICDALGVEVADVLDGAATKLRSRSVRSQRIGSGIRSDCRSAVCLAA